MAARNNNNKKKGKRSCFSFFSGLSKEKKAAACRYAGLTVFVFTMFTLVSALADRLTWQADQSLLSHPERVYKCAEVANCGGTL